MATQNAIDTGKPIDVTEGGTGAATFTDHGVLIGSGTAAITALSVGATGTLLVGAAGADAAFGTSATGDFTFVGALSGSARTLTVQNTSNTADSAATLELKVGGDSGGDAAVKYNVDGTQVWMGGIDNNSFNSFKFSIGSALGTNDVFKITTNGEVTKPLQPAFLAYSGTTDTNATGNGNTFKLGSGNALTEAYDQNGDFNTNGTFTAPVTGKYIFTASIRLGDLADANDLVYIQTFTSNGTYTPFFCEGGPIRYPTTDQLIIPSMAIADMDAADTAYINVVADGATQIVDIVSVGRSTYFAGFLIC